MGCDRCSGIQPTANRILSDELWTLYFVGMTLGRLVYECPITRFIWFYEIVNPLIIFKNNIKAIPLRFDTNTMYLCKQTNNQTQTHTHTLIGGY